ncbi:MAG: acyl-CoA thioesterase [Dehalococcoidales bacterium]|nr:acyl-CoA thioesterase [Dehalococcoidales bacterium]
MKGKTVRESAVVVSQMMTPQDVNLSGNVHGGVIMKLIDTVAAIVAARHARTNIVTASIDRLDFLYPVFAGNLVTLKASLNMVGNSSMEVGVRVETENPITEEIRHTASAYLTYVALDKSGKPTKLPPLILETATDKRRNKQAKARRALRLRERQIEKKAAN